MIVNSLKEIEIDDVDWSQYDVIFLASGFESRSTNIFQKIPAEQFCKCVVLGFNDAAKILSRIANDKVFYDSGLKPFVGRSSLDYEDVLKKSLYEASAAVIDRSIKVFVDYSVMTRVWYAYILTWIKYSGEVNFAEIDFAYSHGLYRGKFENLQIEGANAISGFEGVSAGSRKTVALYGLGYDKFATLTIHEMIKPDKFFCFIANDPSNPESAQHVIRENSEIIDLSGCQAILLPIDNISYVVEKISEYINAEPEIDEIYAVPMGPKTHVLGTLIAGQKLPRLICMHPLGQRENPVQVDAHGKISCWRIEYKSI